MAPVRPRLPNRYEADAAQASAQDFERDDDHAEAARPAGPPAVPEHEAEREPPRARPAARKLQPPEIVEPLGLLRSQPETQPEPAPASRLARAAAPEPTPATERPKNQLESGISSVRRDTAPAASRLIEDSGVDRREQPEPRPAAAHEQAEQRGQRRERAAPDTGAPARIVRPVTPPALPPTPASGVVQVVPAWSREASQPLRASMPAREPSAAIAAAPPRVQVTIGRLEIRAATAQPEPPRHQAKPPPAMSLDDYLTDRGKG